MRSHVKNMEYDKNGLKFYEAKKLGNPILSVKVSQ